MATKIKTVSDVIAEAEAITIKQHAAALAEHQELVNRYTLAAAELDAAQDEVYQIEGSFRTLSDNYDDLAYAMAVAKVIRLQRNMEGKDAVLTQSSRQIPNIDKAAAISFSAAISKATNGRASVHSTFVRNHNLQGFMDQDPFYVVVQGGPTNWSPSGSMAAELSVFFVRTQGFHADMTVEMLEKVLADNHIEGRVGSIMSGPDHQIARVSVSNMAPEVPVIGRVNGTTLANLGLRFAQSLVANVKEGDVNPTRLSNDPMGVYHRRIAVGVARSQIVSETVEDEKRTLIVDAPLYVEIHRADLIYNGIEWQMDRLIDNLTGSFLPSIGRVVSASVIREDSPLFIAGGGSAIERYLPEDDTPKRAGMERLRDIRQMIIRLEIVSRTNI